MSRRVGLACSKQVRRTRLGGKKVQLEGVKLTVDVERCGEHGKVREKERQRGRMDLGAPPWTKRQPVGRRRGDNGEAGVAGCCGQLRAGTIK